MPEVVWTSPSRGHQRLDCGTWGNLAWSEPIAPNNANRTNGRTLTGRTLDLLQSPPDRSRTDHTAPLAPPPLPCASAARSAVTSDASSSCVFASSVFGLYSVTFVGGRLQFGHRSQRRNHWSIHLLWYVHVGLGWRRRTFCFDLISCKQIVHRRVSSLVFTRKVWYSRSISWLRLRFLGRYCSDSYDRILASRARWTSEPGPSSGSSPNHRPNKNMSASRGVANMDCGTSTNAVPYRTRMVGDAEWLVMRNSR